MKIMTKHTYYEVTGWAHLGGEAAAARGQRGLALPSVLLQGRGSCGVPASKPPGLGAPLLESHP